MDTIRGNRTFEDFDPSVEWSRAAEADAVKISLPGFKREEIRVLVDNHGHLRIRGERPVTGTRWARFQKDFKLPDNCNAEGIRAKFESETLTITLPKKVPSPQVAPAAPVPALPRPESRRPAAAPVQKPPQQARPAPPRPTVPAVPLVPAPSQRQPAQRTPSLPSQLPSVPTPAEFDEPRRKPEPVAAGNKLNEESLIKAKKSSFNEDEDQKRMERETRGKMEEDRKMMEENNRKIMEENNRKMMEDRKRQEQQDKEEGEAAPQMARQPRPMAASRGQLVNVAVAVVVLIGITAYVWHTLKNATGDHGLRGYGDEM